MLKTTIAAGFTALLVSASSLTYAQAPSTEGYAQARSTGGIERLSAADVGTLTDARVNIVKAALQLTPDQEKYWPTIEDAIRTRAKDRQARLAAAATRLGERSAIEVLRDRNPVEFVQRRAAALAQRAADLKKLADAWAPLYPTLSPEQKRRMAALTIFVLREMRNGLEQRRLQSEDDDQG
jgi:LTXXQ motif family protein